MTFKTIKILVWYKKYYYDHSKKRRRLKTYNFKMELAELEDDELDYQAQEAVNYRVENFKDVHSWGWNRSEN